jgi:hypothetical protein
VLNCRLCIVALVVGTYAQVTAQTSSYRELQAAYLYNFAKYIRWPSETAQFTIAVYGSSEVMNEFASTLKGKKVLGKPLVLKRIDTTEEMADTQIVFVPEGSSRNLPHMLGEAVLGNVLIVTEEDLIKKGAGVSFVVEGDKLRFKLKKQILDDTRLVVSDGLLRLAIVQ